MKRSATSDTAWYVYVMTATTATTARKAPTMAKRTNKPRPRPAAKLWINTAYKA